MAGLVRLVELELLLQVVLSLEEVVVLLQHGDLQTEVVVEVLQELFH